MNVKPLIPPGTDYVLVFGSNLAGRHGKGAALMARKYYGAEEGVSSGLTGDSYAVPTVDAKIKNKLPLWEIEEYVDELVKTARDMPTKSFFVTRIGCGLAGWTDTDILPMFTKHVLPDNIILPGHWIGQYLDHSVVRVVIAGSRSFADLVAEEVAQSVKEQREPHSPFLERFYAGLDASLLKWRDDGYNVEIVSGTAAGPDQWGEVYAKHRGFDLVRQAADWKRWGKPAGYVRNWSMAQYGTHSITLWDGKSTGTAQMIDISKKAKLHHSLWDGNTL